MERQTLESPKFILRPAHPKDDRALLDLISVPMTTRGIMLSFQRNPSYFQASKVVYQTNDHFIIEEVETGNLVGCGSNGHRPCFINGQIQAMRYGCDLRISPKYRGTSLMKMVGYYVGKMQQPDFNHIIIFNDNIAAIKAVQTGKAGFPDYHQEGLIETLTLTGFKKDPNLQQYLQQFPHQTNPNHLKIVQAQAEHVPLINDFIKEMSNHYNFLPAYNFNELLQQTDYYQGLSIQDFQLYFDQDKLVGMFGLWSQKSFKQSMILDYGYTVGLFRPVYNFIAGLTGRMKLPKKGTSFQYYVLHSLLCHPQNLALHDRMLINALYIAKKNGIDAISYTLSHRDPRQQLNQFYKGELLTGIHGFLCNTRDPRPEFDTQRIPYLEVGRI